MDIKGKKVLVVGLGKSGLAAALFLRRQGAQVTVSDVRSAEALAKEIPALIEEGIAVEAGGHGLLTFRRQDLIVVSPGVPVDTPELTQVRKFGLPIIGELELAAHYLRGKVLAITASNGKTTTTSLCGEILEAGKLPVQVGGNIGVPVIALVEQSRDDGWSVLEVSSFQLETTYEFHPQIAVILNITPDHLDRHGTFENYAAAKEKIFAQQTADDALVLNADDDASSRSAARAKSRVFWFSRTRVVRQGAFVHDGVITYRASEQGAPEPVLKVTEIPLKGAHNVENVLAAVCAARLAGVEAAAIRKAVMEFHAVEHRLEFVAKINGVDYYNDSKATNVDASMKAIAAFPRGIHLILGGKDKNSDYRQMRTLLLERVKTVYTIGAAAEKIHTHIEGSVPIVSAGTLEEAIARAGAAAQPGEVVLLAPACSSFDQFENYEHRGRVFKETVLARRGLAALTTT
jgi:UDP-N-acetylmuramoylalanine--D-glutamate ligase